MLRFALLPPLLAMGLVAGWRPAGEQEKPAAPAAAANAAVEAVSPDEEAIRAVVAEFVRAYNKGDAPALAALFTADARIESAEGQVTTGRAAIEKQFAEAFASAPGQVIAVQTKSLRLLGADAAIEEGVAVVSAPVDGDADADEATPEFSRYSAAYVKKDGRWLQDYIHDFPVVEDADEKSAHDHLKELEWLVGEWVDEDDEGETHTVCDWSEDGSFLLRRFKLKIQGEFVMSGVQRIGWDPRRKQFRSWVFDSEGGFSDGLWAREGDHWVVKTDGVLKNGRTASATNVITREGNDRIRWASIDRVVAGVVLADAEEVILVRKPPEPAPAPTQEPQPKETPQ